LGSFVAPRVKVQATRNKWAAISGCSLKRCSARNLEADKDGEVEISPILLPIICAKKVVTRP
jgi:hypothetical protein